MRAVNPAPGLDQLEDRLLLPLEQPVDRATTRTAVLQRAGLPQTRPPAVRALIDELQHPARPRVRPTVRDRVIDQPQQLELNLRAHARGDRAE